MPFSCSNNPTHLAQDQPARGAQPNMTTTPHATKPRPNEPDRSLSTYALQTPLNPATTITSANPSQPPKNQGRSQQASTGQTNHVIAITDKPKLPTQTPQIQRPATPSKTPSCPARPGAHQNLIHSCQRTNAHPAQPPKVPPNGSNPIRTAPNPSAHIAPSSTTNHGQAPIGPKPKPPAHRHGGGRDRTDDPLLAKQVLSQLSYTPKAKDRNTPDRAHPNAWAREDLNLRPHAYQACALTS